MAVVYTTQSYANPAWITSIAASKVVGTFGTYSGTTMTLAGSGTTPTLVVGAADGTASVQWKNGAGTLSWQTSIPASMSTLVVRDVAGATDVFGFNSALTLSYVKFGVQNTAPEFALIDTDGTSGYRWWRYVVNGDTFFFQRLNDTGTAVNDTPLQFAFNGVATFSQSLKERGRSVALGEWTAVAYNAGNFTTGNASTWTVDAGDQMTFSYTLVGKTMFLTILIINSSVSGSTPTLNAVLPGGFTAAADCRSIIQVQDAGGAAQVGLMRVASGGSTVIFYRDLAGTNWSTATNNTAVQGQIAIALT